MCAAERKQPRPMRKHPKTSAISFGDDARTVLAKLQSRGGVFWPVSVLGANQFQNEASYEDAGGEIKKKKYLQLK